MTNGRLDIRSEILTTWLGTLYIYFFFFTFYLLKVTTHTHLVMSHWFPFHLGGWRDEFLERHLPWASSTKATWMDYWHEGQTDDECTAFVKFYFIFIFFCSYTTFSSAFPFVWRFFSPLCLTRALFYQLFLNFFFLLSDRTGVALKGKEAWEHLSD